MLFVELIQEKQISSILIITLNTIKNNKDAIFKE
jgi:hypothetical protein